MSQRNKQAFLKAARKSGGLSLPSARKAYKQMAEKLGREPKGKDVQSHPRIFSKIIKSILPARKDGGKRNASGGLGKNSKPSKPSQKGKTLARSVERKATRKSESPVRSPRSETRKKREKEERMRNAPARAERINRIRDYERIYEDDFDSLLEVELEYASTAEY